MRVIVYAEAGDVAFDYYTQRDTVSLCPGRLEKAQVVEACRRQRSSSWTPRHQAPRPATFDSMCLRAITESDWPSARFAANTAKLPDLLRRPRTWGR
jgi:hypothetical protein